MITEDYVSFETAKLLKEKGFDEGCSFVANTTSRGVMPVSWPTTNSDIKDENADLIAIPTLQMAMKWLREVHHIGIELTGTDIAEPTIGWTYTLFHTMGSYCNVAGQKYNEYTTYEEACEAAIKYYLENVKNLI